MKKDSNLLIITDYGCDEHPVCEATFTGKKAFLVKCLLDALPMRGEHYTHICEFGHTHRVIFHSPRFPENSSELLLSDHK